MFEVSYGSLPIRYSLLKFSGGELHPRLAVSPRGADEVNIRANLFTADNIMELALLVDAIRRFGGSDLPINLICPYVPYARQDRVCAPGEALGLTVMADIINSLNFASVTVWDVHSDVALAVIYGVRNIQQHEFLLDIPTDGCVLVAPDAGAIKKTMESAKVLDIPMVRADKIRDVKDGKITGTKVYSEHIGDENFLVVDDICDGGRTFIELAKVLRPLTNGKLFLYVTHGIFSKGIEPLQDCYDHIYTVNAWPGFENFAASHPDVLTILR